MRLRHVVLFRFRADTTADQLAQFRAGLDELPSIVGTTTAYRHGPDAGLSTDNVDYAIVADFADLAGYQHYRDHPWHRAFIDERARPITETRTAVQYEIGD